MSMSRILGELWREIKKDFSEVSQTAEDGNKLPNVADLANIKVKLLINLCNGTIIRSNRFDAQDKLEEFIAVAPMLDRRVSSKNESVRLPTKESAPPPQPALSHRLLQSVTNKPSTKIADAIAAAENNDKPPSDDSGSIKSEKKRKFTRQEDSFIWDTYAAYTSNTNLLHDASFNVPDGVVAELAEKLNTNTQKLQAHLRDLKAEKIKQALLESRKLKESAPAVTAPKSDNNRDRDSGYSNKQQEQQRRTEKFNSAADAPAQPKPSHHVRSEVAQPAPAPKSIHTHAPRSIAATPVTPVSKATSAAPATAPLSPPVKYRTEPYSAEEDSQLWSAYEKNHFQFLDPDQLHKLSVPLQRSTDGLHTRLKELIAAQSGVSPEDVQIMEFTIAEDAIIWNAFRKRSTSLPKDADDAARDALQMQVAEELASTLNKFYGRVWYRLQWLKENPITKPAPVVSTPFPSIHGRSPATEGRVAGVSNGARPHGRAGSAPTVPSAAATTKDSSSLPGSKRRRDVEPAVAAKVSPPPSRSAAGKGAQDDTESGEVSSGEEDGDDDEDSESTHSTRTEDSDFLAGRTRGARNKGAKSGNAAGPRKGSRVVDSDTGSEGQDSEQDRARKQSRDKLLRSGRYTEEEDMEIWIAFTAAEGEPPAKLGKILTRVAHKLHRTYNSVAGRLERLLAQQDLAKDQYAPAGEIEEAVEAEEAADDGTATEGDGEGSDYGGAVENVNIPPADQRQQQEQQHVQPVAAAPGAEPAVGEKKKRPRAWEFFEV